MDLYGFGIMLWEMYTGKLPWSDKNYHQMIHTVKKKTLPPDDPHDSTFSHIFIYELQIYV